MYPEDQGTSTKLGSSRPFIPVVVRDPFQLQVLIPDLKEGEPFGRPSTLHPKLSLCEVFGEPTRRIPSDPLHAQRMLTQPASRRGQDLITSAVLSCR